MRREHHVIDERPVAPAEDARSEAVNPSAAREAREELERRHQAPVGTFLIRVVACGAHAAGAATARGQHEQKHGDDAEGRILVELGADCMLEVLLGEDDALEERRALRRRRRARRRRRRRRRRWWGGRWRRRWRRKAMARWPWRRWRRWHGWRRRLGRARLGRRRGRRQRRRRWAGWRRRRWRGWRRRGRWDDVDAHHRFLR